jgi:adenylate cyclase
MKKLVLFIFTIISLSRALFAQDGSQTVVDSLRQELEIVNTDSGKVKILIALSKQYIYLNTDEGIRYGKQALELAEQLSLPEYIANANSVIGSNYVNKADYSSGLTYEYKALEQFENLGDSAKQAVMLRNIAIAHHRSKNFKDALIYHGKAIAFYSALRDSSGVAAVYGNIANTYNRLGEKDSVLEYNMKAKNLYESMGDGIGTARIIGNVANFYAEEGEYGKAMVFYFDALRRETAMKNEHGIIRNLGNIGETYFDIARDSTGTITADSLIPVGKSANLNKAIEYLEAAISGSRRIQHTDYYLAYGEVLSDAYLFAGRTDDAFTLYKEYIAIRDSVYDVDKYNELTRTRLDYEYGKREDSLTFQKQIADVKLSEEKKSRSREQAFWIAGIILVLVFSAFLFNRWRVTQKQKVEIEIEKQRSEELLLNILPEETARELKEKGKSDARLMEHVTVLFTDFKGFTQYAEHLSPQELVAEINECFSAFDRIMEKYGVEKIKTIGDAYMAAGGLPTSNATHATDVINAALEIRKFMHDWASLKDDSGQQFFEIRIGIHTGPVVAGIVGIKKFQYDIWGDTVNIASRMESSGEAGMINISQTTYELVKDKFKCVPRGKIEAKNKGELEMYFVE